MSRKPALTLEQKELLLKNGGTVPAEEKPEKEFMTVFSNGFTHVRIKGGGRVPDCLSGQYTSTTRAEKAIEDYLRERDASASR